jgi:hypothetical protein
MKRNNQKLTNDQKNNNKKLFFNKKTPHPTFPPPLLSKRPQKITNMKIKKVKKYNPRPSAPLLHKQLEP